MNRFVEGQARRGAARRTRLNAHGTPQCPHMRGGLANPPRWSPGFSLRRWSTGFSLRGFALVDSLLAIIRFPAAG